MRTSRFDEIGPSRAGKSMKNENGHEMVEETSPGPLATTILHEISPRFSWHQRFCELRTSWSEPEIVNIINCIRINGLIPYAQTALK